MREGGIVAFITSQGVLDAPTNAPIREYMMNLSLIHIYKSIKTTQIYAKITKEKLNQDMENLAARWNQIEE